MPTRRKNRVIGELDMPVFGQPQTKTAVISKAVQDSIMKRLSSLYSDVITAVVRELFSNANDAVVDAGGGEISITLPKRGARKYVIKDSGVGMSEEVVRKVYVNWGETTKSGNLDAIGEYGLGSKAIFGYTNKSDIVTVHNGKKITFSMVSISGSIESTPLVIEDTAEPNGTEISFNVKEEDFARFKYEATKLAMNSFDIPVTINGKQLDSGYTKIAEVLIHKGDDIYGDLYVPRTLESLSKYASLQYVLGGTEYFSFEEDSYSSNAPFKLVIKPGIVDFNSSRDAIVDNQRLVDLRNNFNLYATIRTTKTFELITKDPKYDRSELKRNILNYRDYVSDSILNDEYVPDLSYGEYLDFVKKIDYGVVNFNSPSFIRQKQDRGLFYYHSSHPHVFIAHQGEPIKKLKTLLSNIRKNAEYFLGRQYFFVNVEGMTTEEAKRHIEIFGILKKERQSHDSGYTVTSYTKIREEALAQNKTLEKFQLRKLTCKENGKYVETNITVTAEKLAGMSVDLYWKLPAAKEIAELTNNPRKGDVRNILQIKEISAKQATELMQYGVKFVNAYTPPQDKKTSLKIKSKAAEKFLSEIKFEERTRQQAQYEGLGEVAIRKESYIRAIARLCDLGKEVARDVLPYDNRMYGLSITIDSTLQEKIDKSTAHIYDSRSFINSRKNMITKIGMYGRSQKKEADDVVQLLQSEINNRIEEIKAFLHEEVQSLEK